MKVGVITFPGTLDDRDALRAASAAGTTAISLWHNDADLKGVDAVILPGGFSYGDYLRCGAISRFAPVMEKVIDAACGGMPLLGICNGFQVLCEAHLLPGALTRNKDLHFLCRDQKLVIENNATAWTSDYAKGQEIVIPLKTVKVHFNVMIKPLQHLRKKAELSRATWEKIPMDRETSLQVSQMSAETLSD